MCRGYAIGLLRANELVNDHIGMGRVGSGEHSAQSEQSGGAANDASNGVVASDGIGVHGHILFDRRMGVVGVPVAVQVVVDDAIGVDALGVHGRFSSLSAATKLVLK